MFIHYRTQGLILKKEDLGEADRLFTIYTKDFGRLEILGKAVRKIKSKLRGGAELFYLSEIEFIQGKTYKTLTDASLIENFKNIRRDLEKLTVGYQISEVFNKLVKKEEEDKEIWNLLNETFEKLNNPNLKLKAPKLLYYYFLWNLLSILGYQPELYNCSICQKNLSTYFVKKYGLDRAQKILCSGLIPEKLYFSSKEGGIIDFNCFRKIKEGKEVEPEVIKILRIFLKKDWQTLLRLKIEDAYEKSLKLISENYLSFISSSR